jgi:hypothetical protein
MGALLLADFVAFIGVGLDGISNSRFGMYLVWHPNINMYTKDKTIDMYFWEFIPQFLGYFLFFAPFGRPLFDLSLGAFDPVPDFLPRLALFVFLLSLETVPSLCVDTSGPPLP